MKKSPVLLPLIMIVAGIFLILSIFLWTTLGSSPAQPTNDPNIPFPEIPRVSLKEAHTAFTSQNALFLDVRDAGSFSSSHIPGAINIPLAELATRQDELDTKAWIITYCT